MPTTVQKLKGQLKKLSVPERTELAHFLIESLGQDSNGTSTDWEKELERRTTEIKSGQARSIAADKVFAKLREKYT